MSHGLLHRGDWVPGRSHGQRGFVLLEILVAFVILAVGLAAISAGVAVAMRSDARSRTNRVALRFAQSRLEAAGIDASLAPGQRTGRLGDRYQWQETVSAVQIGNRPSAPPDAPDVRPTGSQTVSPYWVTIDVRAADGTAVTLSALKLAPEAKP